MRLTGVCIGWIASEIDGWIAARVAERDAATAKPTAAKARSPRKPRPAAAVGEETSGAETCG